jgi:formylglycine-generating enzyme required for sulfatase activity
MGENPSRFVSTERPVEQVSWDDCQEFLKRLNESSPELMARLPSEAEWEHACRGGAPTATWVGDLEILGECNAPLLDEIAWYTGNSGQDYELEDGQDSTDWPNKQYPHTKAGTHEVRKKQANPHGLHDMLGNVLEWCMDTYGSYEEPAVTNPAPSTMGTERVSRGGSWGVVAGDVRAALRGWYSPVIRDDGLGFRLARGQGGWEAGTRSGPVGRGESSNET